METVLRYLRRPLHLLATFLGYVVVLIFAVFLFEVFAPLLRSSMHTLVRETQAMLGMPQR